MLLWTIFKVGIKSLMANKMRSILAMLGIIIGVGSVIAMLALGSGAQKAVLDQFSAMGTNLLIVQPGNRGSGGVMSGSQQNLVLDDALAILREVDGIEQIAPCVNGNAQVKYMGQNAPTSIIGSAVTYLPIRNFQVERGRSFTDTEVDQMARVAILGPETVNKLFGVNDPLGETVKVKGINFKVIGVTKAKGNQGWFNPDEVVIVPFTTAMKQLFGLTYLKEVNVQAKDGADNAKVLEGLTTLLRKRHRLLEGAPDDFTIRNQAEMIASRSEAAVAFKMLLSSVAAISLLVGGIGIMNIMLVSVTERTREIGVRKAIGAKERHILVQFLLESVIVAGLGGLLGVLLGVGASLLLPMLYPAMPAVLEVYSIFLAMGFSGVVGVFFGFYPACVPPGWTL